MKIFSLAASLRKESLNRRLAQRAGELLRAAGPDVTVDLADLREFPMPLYDGDLDAAEGLPAAGRALAERIRAADALVIATPEYNGGISGPFKNAVDWLSRDRPHALVDKPVLLLSATPGALGGVRGLWHTRVPLDALGAFVYPEMFGVGQAHQAFDPAGAFANVAHHTRMSDLAADYLKFARALAAAHRG